MKIKKVYKRTENTTIYGCNRWVELKPLLNGDHSFSHYGKRYKLSQFIRTCLDEFDGICSDSYFSGVLVKLDDTGESVKAFTYIS